MKSRVRSDLLSLQKQVIRKISKLSAFARFFIVLSLFLSVLLYGYLAYVLLVNHLKSDAFTEKGKCPSCYGTSLCEEFGKGEVSLSGLSRLTFLHSFNVKNVYFGYHGNDEVVMKRLGQTKELEDLDKKVCGMAGHDSDCDVTLAIRQLGSQSGEKWMLDLLRGHSDMMACPTQRLLTRILHMYDEKLDAVDLSAIEKMQLVTTMIFNAEPILIQAFPSEEKWPFPKYHGACGRVVVEEDAGIQLIHYYSAPWEVRVNLSHQIMQIADSLTDNESQYALYWTDVSPENLVVNSEGLLRIVDAENILVVDRWQIQKDKKAGWDEPLLGQYEECDKSRAPCVSQSREALCSHYTTDHNYYIACRSLLSDDARWPGQTAGLLHDIPDSIEKTHNLRTLLGECVKPSPGNSRLKLKSELLRVLKVLSQKYNAFKVKE